MLTPTMKLNRPEIAKQYAKDIEVSDDWALALTDLRTSGCS